MEQKKYKYLIIIWDEQRFLREDNMHIIERLPVIITAFTAIITGIISYQAGHAPQTIYARMAVSMVLMFFVGIYIRSSLLSMISQVNRSRRKNTSIQQKQEAGNMGKGSDKPADSKSIIDYKVDDSDDFSPLKISEVIKTNNIR